MYDHDIALDWAQSVMAIMKFQKKLKSLVHYWGDFDEPGEKFYSFLRKRLVIIGVENDTQKSFPFKVLEQNQIDTQSKLRLAGIVGDAALNKSQPSVLLQC
jgi:hypothetical protein